MNLRIGLVLAALLAASCGPKPATTEPVKAEKVEPGSVDPDALAEAALEASALPDPDGVQAKALAAAVRALPPWAPYYAGARLGLDSATDAPGSVQLSFTAADPEAKVAAFYLDRLKARGAPTDLQEPGVRTIEVANAAGDQITSVILRPADDGGGTSVILRHEGGGY